MNSKRGKVYWMALSFVIVTGVLFILKLPQNGFVYAYILLLSFWLSDYIFSKRSKGR